MENGKANSGSNPKGRPRVVVVGSGLNDDILGELRRITSLPEEEG